MLGWLILAFLAGVVLTTAASWYVQRRHVRRVRAAERRARAAERMAEIGAMTGGLAHEIKNPLSTIGLNAQLLHEAVEELGLPEEDQRRLLSRTRALRRETERLGGILTDFLEYAGQVHLDPRPADLGEVVEELADFFLPEAERHGVRLRLDRRSGSPAAPPVVNIDVKLVKQALLNLMLNATQAMHAARPPAADGSKVEPVLPGSAGELIMRTEAGRDPDGRPVARVRVIDTGPGISPETLAQVFNPYFTTRSGGSGLGLPTSRRLIQEHGGRIDAHSEIGRGSEFTVVLPLHAEEPE